MTNHATGTREEWLEARLELLTAEKELTRRGDEVARRRLALPWVPIEKEYGFETDGGPASLAELFCGRSQLIVYHFMFGPDYSAGCPACSAIADGFDGFAVHLANHDVMLWAVSRAPLEKLQGYRERMGWSFPWASSVGSDFNVDFGVVLTEEQERAGAFEYNFRESSVWSPPDEIREPFDAWAATTGTSWTTYTRERPGMSAFALDDGVVYHTYSAYARGLDGLWGMYQWLDRAPRGRNEAREPLDSLNWFRRHDEYDPAKPS
jgi:predicted dithiol-disulfide oxidoreductase (DUF899 family)